MRSKRIKKDFTGLLYEPPAKQDYVQNSAVTFRPGDTPAPQRTHRQDLTQHRHAVLGHLDDAHR